LAYVSGEDGVDLMVPSERGRKYAMEVRTKIVFHPTEQGSQQK